MSDYHGYHAAKPDTFAGKRVTDFLVLEDGIRIEFSDGTALIGDPEGDCCAVTNIVEVSGHEHMNFGSQYYQMVGTKVEDLGEVSMPYGDVKDVFATIATFRRMTDTSRNSDHDVIMLCTCDHNGYYGGWIRWTLAPEGEW